MKSNDLNKVALNALVDVDKYVLEVFEEHRRLTGEPADSIPREFSKFDFIDMVKAEEERKLETVQAETALEIFLLKAFRSVSSSKDDAYLQELMKKWVSTVLLAKAKLKNLPVQVEID